MKILLLLLLLSSSICYGQQDNEQTRAGLELMRFYKIHTIGGGLELAGLGLAALSTATIKNGVVANNTAAIASFGALVSFAGYIVEATSYKHIKRAGLIMTGNGVAVPILYRKKKHS